MGRQRTLMVCIVWWKLRGKPFVPKSSGLEKTDSEIEKGSEPCIVDAQHVGTKGRINDFPTFM